MALGTAVALKLKDGKKINAGKQTMYTILHSTFFKRVQVINFGEIAPKNRTQGMWAFDKTVKRSHSFFFCPANNVINCTMYTVADFIIFLPLRLRLKKKT